MEVNVNGGIKGTSAGRRRTRRKTGRDDVMMSERKVVLTSSHSDELAEYERDEFSVAL